ncbi:MAG: hypothetical protein M3N95_18560 [Actinomycetota bacterium]|nr:hypothetical protein [Actinomycetota bacterium]
MRKRIEILMVALAMTAGLALLVGPSAHAATNCGTYSKTWFLSDGSVSLRIMSITTHLEVCNSDGSVSTSAESTDYSFTGPGISTGWVGSYGGSYRTNFDSASGGWYRANGNLRQCASHWTAVLCGYTESYFVNSSVVMQPMVVVRAGPGQLKIGSRVFTFSFSPHCGNSHCGVRFNTSI